MEYNRETFINTLDLGETYFRFGQPKKLVHKWKISVYENLYEDSFISIVEYSFINTVETSFHGNTEEEVLTLAHTFAEEMFLSVKEQHNKKKTKQANLPVSDDDSVSDFIKVNNSGGQFSGKRWLGNKETKERLRVDPSEVQAYLNKGWIPVGPRTKL